MKYTLTILLILILRIISKANFIDLIKTDKQVEDFIHKQGDSFKYFSVANFETLYSDSIHRKTADSLGVRPWIKADFDKNGLSDLLVYGELNSEYFLLVFLDHGNKILFHSLIDDSIDYLYFPLVTYKDNLTLLILHKSSFSKDKSKKKKIITQAITYKFGGFIEPNFIPTTYNIEKVMYTASSCLGTCPVFEIEINSNLKATLNAIKFNDKEGRFKTVLNKTLYDSIASILNYIDFPKLEDNYAVEWTDYPTSTLTITYNNGKKKKIVDYGETGTRGLNLTYNKLFELKKKQKWEK